MDLKNLENKNVLLFGKSRAFSEEEFIAQMKFHKIGICREYSDNIAFVIDGAMMTPYEEIESEKLYEQKLAEFIKIDTLEKELAREIDEDTLLMSLKLSHDTQRLKNFLKNSSISDNLFFRLISMYSWGGEDFFDNNDNRDVTAGLIARFYENIEQNHNVEYATTGLIHLVSQTKNAKLLEVISKLEPSKNSLKLLKVLAIHSELPKSVIKSFLKFSNDEIKSLLAMRDDCDVDMQDVLYKDGFFEALSYNSHLDKKFIKELYKYSLYAKNIAKHIILDDEIFTIFKDKYYLELAQNISLDNNMLKKLFAKDIVELNYEIYKNSSVSQDILKEAYKDKSYHKALSFNSNTPKDLLLELFKSNDEEILVNLAKNENTPVEILYQLQLDSRFERYVKTNAGFGKYIKTNNIGWKI